MVVLNLVVDGGVNAITTTFATSHLVTMQALETLVEAVAGIKSATVGGASNRTLTIVGQDTVIDVTDFSITAGASQAGMVETRSTAYTLVRGIALHEHKGVTAAGVAGYEAEDAVNVLRRGKVWCTVVDTVADGDDVYISYAVGAEGKLRNDNTQAIQIPAAKFRSAATTGLLAIVEVNAP